MPIEGKCVLVGAGPGDPGLVTLHAKDVIEHAEVILYDYLCNPEILKWAPAAAEIVFAGKRAGEHTLSQAEINQLMISRAQAGKYVVRLKGGDPFVFGRGAEEAEALAAAGVRFEVVPGVTSAVAAPAYAGIPITHRDVASSFSVFTGHEDPTQPESDLDYESLVKTGGTLVMLMGVERLEKVVNALRAHGADPSTPAALVRWGTFGRQETITGDLTNIVDRAAGFAPPAVAIFGKVVSYRQKLNWFEKRPLFGRRIVVTRTRRQAGALSTRLSLLGADVIELPTIRIEPPKDLMEFGELVRDAYQYDWLIFTSPNGVNAFFDMFFRLYQDTRNIGNVRVAAIGSSTALRIKDYHLTVDVQPDEFIGEAIVEELLKFESVENLRFLLVRAEGARGVIPKQLTQHGAIVDEAIAYRTVTETEDSTGARERFERDGADLMTFTSSSTVTNFLGLKLPWPAGLRTASIGPITSETMRQAGLKVDIEAARHDIDGLVDAIVENLGR
jgi:uroporphyrinogen III methyltransferase/synthase